MNGTNTQVYVPYGNLSAEEFQVVESSGQISLYYVGKFDFLDKPQGSEDQIALITDLNIMGDDLFFTVEWSVRAEESFGWRPVYRRQRSVFYTMPVGGSEPVELYAY